MNEKLELYLVTLWNDNKIVVTVKPKAYEDVGGISEKKKLLKRDLNKKFGVEHFVKFVKFYGFADADIRY